MAKRRMTPEQAARRYGQLMIQGAADEPRETRSEEEVGIPPELDPYVQEGMRALEGKRNLIWNSLSPLRRAHHKELREILKGDAGSEQFIKHIDDSVLSDKKGVEEERARLLEAMNRVEEPALPPPTEHMLEIEKQFKDDMRQRGIRGW